MEDDKNCQVNMWPVKPTMCGDDRKCQSTQFYKKTKDQVNMWPVRPTIDMWSVEPATYKKMCSDKNCQSKRCCKKKSPVRPVWDDKNCQSAKTVHYRKCHIKYAGDTIHSYVVSAKDCVPTDWVTA